jgi:hypothetical protein
MCVGVGVRVAAGLVAGGLLVVAAAIRAIAVT